MAKKELVTTGRTYLPEDVEALRSHDSAIFDAQNQSEGLAATIAFHLYQIDRGQLYGIEECKSTAEYAAKKYGISKGTVSNTLSTFARFGDKETGKIADKYAKYSFSVLMRMKALTDGDIDRLCLSPTMSRSQVVDLIKEDEERREKQEKVPEIIKECESMLKGLSVSMDKAELEKICHTAAPSMSMSEDKLIYEDAVRLRETLVDMIENKLEEDEVVRLVEQPEEEDEDEQVVTEEPGSMPVVEINIADFAKNGVIQKKQLLASIWTAIEKEVMSNECELHVFNGSELPFKYAK